MTWAGKLFHFFIYSNLFIAFCAVLMVNQTAQLFVGAKPDLYFTGFVFFSTICSYSFHWYLTPSTRDEESSRMQWLHGRRNIHTAFFFLGIAGVIFCGLHLLNYWLWLGFAAGLAFLYSAPKIPHPWFAILRRVAYGKTIFLAFTWMLVTTVLPLIISTPYWKNAFTLFSGYRFFYIYAICILFDFRDRENDRSIGIRSLITWLGPTGIGWLFTGSLVAALLFIFLISGQLAWTTTVALTIPVLVTASLFRYSQRHFSDFVYYFLLDGLMVLPAILTLPFGG
jgi:1,4-dihydroxy-2-naphthoate octaprenyltransferase